MKSFLIERFNFYAILRILINIHSVEEVFILDSVDFYENNTNKKNFYEEILLYIQPNIKIIRLPLYQEAPSKKEESSICWIANKITLDFLASEHYLDRVENFIAPLNNLVGDRKVKIAIDKLLMPYFFQKILFFLQCNNLSKSKDNLTIISSDIDHFEIGQYLKLPKSVLKEITTLRIIYNLLDICSSVFLLLTSPLLNRDIFRRGIRLTKPSSKKYDTAIHLVSGFSSKELEEQDKMKRINFGDDIYFDYGFLDPRSNIYLRGRWAKPKKIESSNKKIFKEMNTSFVDENRLKIPLSFMINHYLYKGVIKLFFKYIVLLFKINSLSPKIIFNIQKAYLSYLSHMVFCQYFKTKVFLSRDDYDADHILRTIVQEKYGLLNTGLQHSALTGPIALPFHAHVYFHRYYIAGRSFPELWSPFWDSNISMKSVGTHREHCIVEAKNNSSVVESFREKYKDQINILLLFSSPDDTYSPLWLLNKKYEGLERILELDNRIHLIVRPRDYNASNYLIEIFPSLERYINDGRLTIEVNDFTTQELIPNVDICVAEDASSLILESCFLENLLLISLNARYPTPEFLKNILAQDMDELIILIEGYLKNGISAEAKNTYELLKNEYSVQPPGLTWSRIAEDIKQQLDTLK